MFTSTTESPTKKLGNVDIHPVASHARGSCPTPQTFLLERIVSLFPQLDAFHACEWKLESLPIHLAPIAPKQAHLSSCGNAIATLEVFKLPNQRGPALLYQDIMKVVEELLDMDLIDLMLFSVKSRGRLKIWVNTSFYLTSGHVATSKG